MDTEPPESNDSKPPEKAPEEATEETAEEAAEEPVTAVPTRDTTPVWVHTVPVSPAESTEPPHESSDDDEALPALPMQKGDPDWSHIETEEEPESGTSPPAAAKKETPEWAQTVPTSPGQPLADDKVASVTEPPEQVASNAVKSTWPPAAEPGPAPPEETDIWPPEPPTERAMPVWPPPSELEEEPATPAKVIPTWEGSFDTASPSEITHEPAPPPAPKPAEQASTVPSGAAKLPAPITSAPEPEPEPFAPSTVSMPPAKASEPPPPPAPVKPAQPPAASRPAWAPAMPSEPAAAAPKPGVEWPAPVEIPSWAPRISTVAEPTTSQPGTPTWFSPKEEVRHTSQSVYSQPSPPTPAAVPVAPAPAPRPIPQRAAPAPVAQTPVATPAPAQPAQQPAQSKASWEVVEQTSKSGPHKKAEAITPEDRSYAEWFAWAKRGGAPASVCHAAAQGAFAALTSGKDVATAVQWATAAMSRPPENVSYSRQTYCAWFALANIDLNLDQQRSHAFATGALNALDAGLDASAAHAAGLAAAGIR